MIFGDFTKRDLEKWLEKKGMETEMRENVKDFCKVAGYFINGLRVQVDAACGPTATVEKQDRATRRD